jgi:hypothetical protein
MRPGIATGAVAGVLLTLAAGGLAGDEPAGADSLIESPQPIAAALRTRFGEGLRIRSLRIQLASAEVEVQDPAQPANLDRYAFEDGALGPAEPIQAGRNRRENEARLFSFAEVDLSQVPRLLEDARRRAETPDGRVIQVVIERTEGYGEYTSWGWPLLRFTVNGPRGGAMVEYRLNGTHRHTTRW